MRLDLTNEMLTSMTQAESEKVLVKLSLIFLPLSLLLLSPHEEHAQTSLLKDEGHEGES